jgi:hypothetical protein
MLKRVIFVVVALLTISALAYGIYRGEMGETLFNGAML